MSKLIFTDTMSTLTFTNLLHEGNKNAAKLVSRDTSSRSCLAMQCCTLHCFHPAVYLHCTLHSQAALPTMHAACTGQAHTCHKNPCLNRCVCSSVVTFSSLVVCTCYQVPPTAGKTQQQTDPAQQAGAGQEASRQQPAHDHTPGEAATEAGNSFDTATDGANDFGWLDEIEVRLAGGAVQNGKPSAGAWQLPHSFPPSAAARG